MVVTAPPQNLSSISRHMYNCTTCPGLGQETWYSSKQFLLETEKNCKKYVEWNREGNENGGITELVLWGLSVSKKIDMFPKGNVLIAVLKWNKCEYKNIWAISILGSLIFELEEGNLLKQH